MKEQSQLIDLARKLIDERAKELGIVVGLRPMPKLDKSGYWAYTRMRVQLVNGSTLLP